jgi:hypothetical protein
MRNGRAMHVPLAPGLILTADAVASGCDDRQLARACEAGHLVRVSRGAYVTPETWSELDPRGRQALRAVAAARTRRRTDLALSHESAALVWGLPTWGWPRGPVEFLAAGDGRAHTTPDVRVRLAPTGEDDVTSLDGVSVTSLRRTVLDLLSTRDRAQSVVLVDHVLRTGALTRADLTDLLDTRPGARNRRRAAWAVAFGDARAESPGESVSRVLASDAGFVSPQLQRPFSDARGPIGVVDFFFPDPDGSGRGRIGEFDGDVKYLGGQFRQGRTPEQVVAEEKAREDRLRALATTTGFVRWTRHDLTRPQSLAGLLAGAGVGRPR